MAWGSYGGPPLKILYTFLIEDSTSNPDPKSWGKLKDFPICSTLDQS